MKSAPGMSALAQAGGAVGGMMGQKMGLGPSKVMSPVPPTTPTSMNPMNQMNQPREMNTGPMIQPNPGTEGIGQAQYSPMMGAQGPQQAMGGGIADYTGGNAMPAQAMQDLQKSYDAGGMMGGGRQDFQNLIAQQQPQSQGIGPSFGQQMNPMMRRRQMM
jgi:hypothetical protein